MNVTNEITVYEEDGKDTNIVDKEIIRINSHQLYNDRVILIVGDHTYTVMACELEAAIANAKNTGKGLW